MDSDRPINRKEDDRLGFAPIAKHLAQVIVDQTASDGLVIGIEGRWGSGKSTLINLTIEALKLVAPSPPEIVEFSPWLVGDRDSLLRHLFDDLASAAVRIDPRDETDPDPQQEPWLRRTWKQFRGNNQDRFRRREEWRKRIGGKLRAFGDVAGGLSKIAATAGKAGVPLGAEAGAILDRLGEAAKNAFSASSLPKQKSELVDELRRLSRQIIVFVDDLDRLEPREAAEVLRLIRAVADFPNVIYVLSYDRDVLALTLQNAVQIDDGGAYLEKIVQVSFRVPRPEPFDLRRWFQDEVHEQFAEELPKAEANPYDVTQRLSYVIDVQGDRYLTTPRHVVRAVNALRLHGVPVRGDVDIADMVWLQLVRIGNPSLYSWIEEYVADASAIYQGATVADHSAIRMGLRLDQIFEAEGVDTDRARFDLAEIMPGVSRPISFDKKEEGRRVYNIDRRQFDKFIVGRRLGSPEHYRYYFALTEPAGALRDSEVKIFLDMVQENPSAAVRMFAELANKKRPQGGVMAEVLIDRLTAAAAVIPTTAILGIAGAFADILDDIARASPRGEFGRHRGYLEAEHAMELLLKRVVSPEQRAAILKRLFNDGKALGWLTRLLRSEIFAHGHYGSNAQPENQWLLTRAEFNDVLATMLRRFTDTPPQVLMQVPELTGLLYGWQQGSNNDDARKWVEANTQTDSELLTVLSRMRSWIHSSTDGIYYPLKRKDLTNFLDYERVIRRVRRIADDGQAPAEQRRLAAELLIAFEQGKDED